MVIYRQTCCLPLVMPCLFQYTKPKSVDVELDFPVGRLIFGKCILLKCSGKILVMEGYFFGQSREPTRDSIGKCKIDRISTRLPSNPSILMGLSFKMSCKPKNNEKVLPWVNVILVRRLGTSFCINEQTTGHPLRCKCRETLWGAQSREENKCDSPPLVTPTERWTISTARFAVNSTLSTCN